MAFGLVLLRDGLLGPLPPPVDPDVTVVPTTLYQVMGGWEATAQIGQTDFASIPWRDATIDMAVNTIGINQLRVEIRAGAENDQDYFAQKFAGTISSSVWNAHKYATVNDNADPNSRDDSKFFWTEIDQCVDVVVTPFKAAVEANGESLYIKLCYVAFNTTTGHVHSSTAEYAEFLLAVFQHLDSTYGWVPDAVEVILEPDNGTFFDSGNGTLIGQAIKAAGDRLAAAGYTPDFTAPSTENMGKASTWYDAVKAVSGASAYVKELAYHRYLGVSDANLAAIKSRVIADGKTSAMLEWVGATVETLWADITKGYCSSWQQYTLAYPTASDTGGQYILVSGSTPSLASRTHGLALYFKNVRRGAQRIGCTTTETDIRPVAFKNVDDKLVVILHVDAPRDVVISGLTPFATYSVTRATTTASASSLPDVTTPSNGAATISVPSASVVALVEQ